MITNDEDVKIEVQRWKDFIEANTTAEQQFLTRSQFYEFFLTSVSLQGQDKLTQQYIDTLV